MAAGFSSSSSVIMASNSETMWENEGRLSALIWTKTRRGQNSRRWEPDKKELTLQQLTARLKRAAGQSPAILANASTSRPKS